jgi:Rap1a immunity proteins
MRRAGEDQRSLKCPTLGETIPLMKILWLFTLLFSLLAVPLSAQTREYPEDSGNAFLRVCSAFDKDTDKIPTTEAENVFRCLGYVGGFMSGVVYEQRFPETATGRKVPAAFCVPNGVEEVQTIRIVLKYIRDNPADAHLSTAGLIIAALRKAYPCPSQ